MTLGIAAVTALAAAGSIPRARSAVGTAFVRANQVGYPGAATKRAYLLSTASEVGATFSVKNASGATMYKGEVGASLGSWSTT